jgi:hypothetical protein
MQAKFQTDKGKADCCKSKRLAEPPNGWIKLKFFLQKGVFSQ